jgi:hypothetical protein
MWDRQSAKNDVGEDVDRRTRIQVCDIIDTNPLSNKTPRPSHRLALKDGHEDTTDQETQSDEQRGVHDASKGFVLDEA